MKKVIPDPFNNNRCFFCGPKNEAGLKLKFFWDEEKQEASTDYLPVVHFAGQGTILHGGIQMGLLDEIMGWTSYVFTKKMAVTSGLDVKFLHPAYMDGNKLSVTCRVDFMEGPKVTMTAALFNREGIACTTASGTYHVLSPDKYDALIQGRR